jgi:glucosamine--fructose-6-phosphate aminotransferase (isomerizing)
VGYIGNKPQAGSVCIQGLQILESRGYDSCGIVSIDKDKTTGLASFVTTKFASSERFGGDCIKRMAIEGASRHNHNIGIAHTRWATHGDKTDVNAHPHFDHKDRVALIHNGIIGNYFELMTLIVNEHKIIPRS